MKSTIGERIKADRRGVMSSLWVFVLLNMLFRDIHEFARPGAIEEFMSMDVAEGVLLVSGVVLTVFISMIVLTRVLPYRATRWGNIVVSVVAIGGMVANPPGDLDDIWFFAVELAAIAGIIALAWTWHPERTAEVDTDPIATTTS